jgi:hypothetical protein
LSFFYFIFKEGLFFFSNYTLLLIEIVLFVGVYLICYLIFFSYLVIFLSAIILQLWILFNWQLDYSFYKNLIDVSLLKTLRLLFFFKQLSLFWTLRCFTLFKLYFWTYYNCLFSWLHIDYFDLYFSYISFYTGFVLVISEVYCNNFELL